LIIAAFLLLLLLLLLRQPGTYSLHLKNCNHFAEAFVRELTGEPVPAWINRAAGIGEFVLGRPTPPTEQSAAAAAAAAAAASNSSSSSSSSAKQKDKSARPELSAKQREMLDKLKVGKK
jgi:PPPDE putative peptidase domain